MSKEQLDALMTEVLDRMRNAQDELQLDKAAVMAKFYATLMSDARLAGEW